MIAAALLLIAVAVPADQPEPPPKMVWRDVPGNTAAKPARTAPAKTAAAKPAAPCRAATVEAGNPLSPHKHCVAGR